MALMAGAFVCFYSVRELKVLGGECAGTYANESHGHQTAKLLNAMPREGSSRKVYMNPISKGHIPKTATE
eukprot:CAMPEP_0197469900 /NCGR_PEP_ID=MMETSP1309-20131121/421_1 /TAXON_ID=464262 /ORGANISM="Genus nov. species nov., Strain RCC998" /LENGTH=69 /DNA_ID=CAMNT_0043006247 /DNA_START=111 /DNA_END=320 /DNA_ORIENTATION=+